MESNNQPEPTIVVNTDLLIHLQEASTADLPLEEVQGWSQRERGHWIKGRAASLSSGSRVLDVGAGSCPYRENFSHCTYHTHDIRQCDGESCDGKQCDGGAPEGRAASLPASEERKMDFLSDILELPVESGAYDAVICTEVLNYVSEPIRALGEITRVLKPGGRLFLTASLTGGLHQPAMQYYGGFSPEWYRLFCRDFGLNVVSIDALGGFFKVLSQECARISSTIEQHRDLHGGRADQLSRFFAETLSRYFYALDGKQSLQDSTAGYMVEAVRLSSVDQIQMLIDQDPNNGRLYVSAARLALETDLLDRAAAFIEDLMEIEPGSVSGRKLLNELEMRKVVA